MTSLGLACLKMWRDSCDVEPREIDYAIKRNKPINYCLFLSLDILSLRIETWGGGLSLTSMIGTPDLTVP